MTDAFHHQIQSALANPGLQIALDANAERRLNARQQAYTSLPEDWEIMRKRAHSVREETIKNLDRYLDEFIEKVRSNGIIVHRAADAAEAVQIVVNIASQNGAKLIAKSKSMVSEEIGLNHALEAAGLRVVETDLGEYIIQLRGERPAHIITPAVHLRKEDVGETFHEKLGIPYTDDIAVMTGVARKNLRETFLSADIGISGVNFGVAESGTLCLVTNEGNGRMVTTVPPVHIALMGMERLVPTMKDLALMLALLPRSATGQKLTVYTSLIHGPKRAGDPDGPGERHLILVNNGRERMRQSPLSEALLCIRCGACLNACPVFREIGGHGYVGAGGKSSTYPGPIGSIVSPGLFGQEAFGQLARASSLCAACKEACPVNIDLPKMLLRVRAGGVELKPERARKNIPSYEALGLRVFSWLATDSRRFSTAERLFGIASRFVAPFSEWLKMPAFSGWGANKDLPRPAARPFRVRWAQGEIGPRSTAEAETQARLEPGDRGQDEGLQPPRPARQERLEEDALVDRFSQELAELGGTFVACDESELTRLILDFLNERKIESILSWEAEQLPGGLLNGLKAGGVTICHEFDPSIRAGLTGATAAIAETGTLVLPLGEGRPAYASLTPEIHIAVLRAKQIYRSMPQVLELPEVLRASCVALISGPSRTADIEMTLTIGVHGPGEVLVFCLNGN